METLERERDGRPDRELYALLHLAPEASDDDVKRAYRQWAQVYHPDKHQTPQMQDIATQNFQRIREAYEILSDERKRQIYDLYGMEGLSSGLELGPKLKSREEVRAEFERLQQRQEERKLAAHVHQRGSLQMNVSLVPFLRSYDAPRIGGMAMSTQVQAQVSKRDTLVMGGNMALRRGVGGGSVTMVVRRQLSPVSSVELLAMAGVRSILSVHTSRQLSTHSTGTSGVTVSLRDGSVTLANTWSRQLSEDTTGTIGLEMGPDTGVSVGWQRHAKKNAGSADVKVGPAMFGISGQYIRHFSAKSQGRVTGKIGSTGVEMEVGGERRLSEHSSAAMFCVVGLQGVSWKVRFTRGGQKFVIPIVLCTTLNPLVATGALIIPSTIYAVLKTLVLKPYNLKRNRRKSLELRRATYAQVVEARASSEKAQLLLKNVAERKKQKQAQRQGLVILSAVYGDIKAYERGASGADKSEGTEEDDDSGLPAPYLDVGIPIQFLVDDFGQLRLHDGVKKAGLMGFCDPCPGESKQLKVSYSYLGRLYEVVVGDFDELRIPQEAHRIQQLASERLDQRSSFWLQYGRARRHLQACDSLLEQINTCAVPPGGRPVMDMPAGIMRKGESSSGSGSPFCEIPAHAVPESPLDVGSDLGLSNGESVPGMDVEAHRAELDGLIGSTELEGSSWVTDGSSGIQVAVDAWIEEGCACGGSMGSELGDQDAGGQQSWRESVVIELGRDLDGSCVAKGGEGRVSRCSVGCSPESVVAGEGPAPAATSYVEDPSKVEILRDARMTQRRSSFCRIEALVIRSRSTRAVPVPEHGSKRAPSNPQG